MHGDPHKLGCSDTEMVDLRGTTMGEAMGRRKVGGMRAGDGHLGR